MVYAGFQAIMKQGNINSTGRFGHEGAYQLYANSNNVVVAVTPQVIAKNVSPLSFVSMEMTECPADTDWLAFNFYH